MEVFRNLYSVDVVLCLHLMQFLFPWDVILSVYCNKHKLANLIVKANFADVRKLIENFTPRQNNFSRIHVFIRDPTLYSLSAGSRRKFYNLQIWFNPQIPKLREGR